MVRLAVGLAGSLVSREPIAQPLSWHTPPAPATSFNELIKLTNN